MTIIHNTKYIIRIRFALFVLTVGAFSFVFFVLTQHDVSALTRQIPVSGRMETPAKASVPDGNYTMRFSIYTVNRTSADTFPSDTDSGSRLWTETQTVAVERGVWRTTLGAVTALPSTLNFDSGNYFLGIRVNTDSEMIPRKKILPVPLAIDSESVGGSLSGTGANNVLKLDSSGSINIAGNITTAGSLQAANFLFTGTVDLPVDSVLTGDILDGTISTIDLADSVITTVKIADGSITNVKLSTGDLHFQNTDTGTTSLSFGLGTGTAVGTNNFSIPVSNAANKPAVRYNGSTGKWQISNDGTTFSDILLSAAAGITSLNGLTGTTQTFANDANITITSVGTTHTLVWSGTLGVARGGTGTGTTFTTGSVLFAGASGVYAQDNANFFWDNSAKRLGIGTASPSVQLEIYNSTANPTIRIHGDGANTIDPTLIFATNSNNYGNIRYDRSENNFYITNGYNDNTTNGGIRLGTSEPSGPAYNFILQSKTGNVGIGAAITPAAKLHVQGGTTSSGATTMTAAGAASTFTTSASITINAGDYIIPTTTTSQSRAVTVGGTGTSFTVSPVFAANVTAETFTIYHPITNLVDNSGNSKLFVQGGTGIVGLGTIAPNPFANNVGTLLHAVADNSNFIIESPLGANNEAMIMFSKVGEFGAPKWSFGRSTWGGANPDTLSLFEDNTTANTRLTVMAGGNVGIGTATPEAKLDVRGSIQIESGSDSTIRGNLEIHQLANGDNIFWAHRQTDSSPTGNFIQYQNGARTSTLFAVDINGNTGIGLGSSTARLHVQGGTTSSGATTMTASNGATTFTTSVSITLNAGDYIIPTTTTAQARAVTIGGTGTSFTVSPAFSANVTAETFTIYPAITNLADNAGNTGLFLQGSTRNVGIGTASPLTKLSVVGDLSAQDAIEGVGGVNNSASVVGYSQLAALNTDQTANTWSRLGFGDAVGGQQISSGVYGFFTDHTNDYGDIGLITRSAAGLTEKLRVTSTGSVGIGQAPTHIFDVRGYIAGDVMTIQNTYSSGASSLMFENTVGEQKAAIGYGNTGMGVLTNEAFFGSTAGIDVVFFTDDDTAGTISERVRIKAGSGNVGIGTASPTEKLTIRQDNVANLFGLYDGANNTTVSIADGGALTFKPTAFDTVFEFDGAVYTNQTTEAKTTKYNAGNSVISVLSIEGSSNDEFYLGLDHKFNKAYLDIQTAGAGVTLSAQYWNGAWTALSITDGTANLTTDGSVTFTAPSDWVTTAVNSVTKYWIRLRSPATNITTNPGVNMVAPNDVNVFRVFGHAGDTNPALFVNAEGDVRVSLNGTASTAAICGSHGTATSGNLTNVLLSDCSGAPAADYAEMYPVADDVDYGDIVAVGTKTLKTKDGDNIIQLVKSRTAYQQTVIGIISNNYGDFTSAGYNIKQEDNPKPVALNGRVPVKVSLENGPIVAGDPLTSSSVPGVAMQATGSGYVIGKALESFDESRITNQELRIGKILVFVNPGWYTPPAMYAAQGGNAEFAKINIGEMATVGELIVTGSARFEGALIVLNDATFAGNVLAKKEVRVGGKIIATDVDLSGGLVVEKATQFKNDLETLGIALFRGDAVFDKTLSVRGGVNVQGLGVFSGDLNVGGTISATKATVQDLIVNGSSVIAGDLVVKGTVKGDLNVSGLVKTGQGIVGGWRSYENHFFNASFENELRITGQGKASWEYHKVKLATDPLAGSTASLDHTFNFKPADDERGATWRFMVQIAEPRGTVDESRNHAEFRFGLYANDQNNATIQKGTDPHTVKFMTCAEGVCTTTDNIAVDPVLENRNYILMIKAGEIKLMIDGSAYATHATNIPTASVLHFHLDMSTSDDAVRSASIDYIGAVVGRYEAF